MWSWNQSTEQATNVGVNAHKRWDPHISSTAVLTPHAHPQAAINAMNLEQQLSQYAFFSQQPSSQNHQRQQVSFFSKLCPQKTDFSLVRRDHNDYGITNYTPSKL